jgi:uncharacterized protein (TIGR03067 family)
MRYGILLVAIFGASMAASTSPSTEAKAGDELQGTWEAVSAARNGGAAEDLKGHRLTFSGERFTITSKGKMIYQGTYTIDSSQKPATIDFKNTAGQMKGRTWLGIYQLAGERLKICDNADDVSRARPTAFVTERGSGQVLVDFNRSKR